ncbi:condensation domain-containing protein [Dactylosporangium sp. CS-047395]|uniref:condensation domain-containing protein n=1 Tax=Dactylosporangium sp. CS-047395 TaxID=3239936 RepID=UPI003D91F23D
MRAPVTPAQRRLWFLAQVDPDALDWHIPLAYRLRGPLDAPALAAALRAVVARHGALRTRFPLDGAGPVQEILDDWRPDVPILDALDITTLANTPFDLTAAPPVRAAILRTAPDEHIFVLVLHHIVADAWSLRLLRDELAALYAGLDLPPLVTQYADLAALPRPDGAATLAYWTDQLAGAPVLELPTDRPRPARRGSEGSFDGFELGPERAADLRTLAMAGRTTPFMTVLAVYLALLGLTTGQDDISVGSPVSGRDRTDAEPLIGYFLDTVVLRGDLAGNPTFRELLGRVKATALAAYQHRELPFEDLIARLDVRRDPARTPLFDTMLVVHSGSPDEGLSLPGISSSYVDPGHRAVKFDLTLECVTGAELKVVAQYRRELFDADTVAVLVRRFGELIRLAANDPGARLSELYTGLAASEQGSWECSRSTVDRRLLDLIDFSSTSTALVCGDDSLSYAELDARVRAMAAQLDGRLTGVRLNPGIDLVVALLATWRAGGGYLPLDPDAPARRIEEQLADSGAGAVITADGIEQRTGQHVPPVAYAMYTSGSTGRPKAVAVPHAALAARVEWMRERYKLTPADRVLQFASPSFDTFGEEVYPCLAAGATLVIPTGNRAELPDFLATPQGQGITVLDLPTSYWHELCADPATVAWPKNLRLLILGGEQVRADALQRWFAHVGEGVEVLNTYGPTEATIIATAAHLTPADTHGRPPIGHPIDDTCVHVIGLGNAPVPDGVAGELVIGGVGLADGYLNKPDLTAERFIDIGGVRHYRTGDRARRRPHHNESDRTRPHANDATHRDGAHHDGGQHDGGHHSGGHHDGGHHDGGHHDGGHHDGGHHDGGHHDGGHHDGGHHDGGHHDGGHHDGGHHDGGHHDGAFEFLGRIDEQLKVRGYRIEPAEVEAALLTHPAIGHAVVSADDGRLVAHLVAAHAATAPTPAEIRAHLDQLLPEYLQPRAYAVLDRLPMTRNGKVDRAALPPVAAEAGEGRPPETDAERLVAEVWQDVLGVDNIRAGDDFFDLGGHSLLATRVVARLRAGAGIEVPLRTIFTATTVGLLAVAVEDLLLAEIEALDDDEVRRLLAEEAGR